MKPFETSIRFGIATALFALCLFLIIELKPLREWFGLRDQSVLSPGDSSCALRVVSYSGFIAEWGPGPELGRRFKAQSGCDIQWIDGVDSSRLLEKAEIFEARVAVGLDAFTIQSNVSQSKLLKLDSASSSDLNFKPSLLDFEKGIALDWSPMGFLSRIGELQPPKNWTELFSGYYDREVTLIDPRMSAPGRLMLRHLLTQSQLDPKALGYALQRLSDGVSPGWSSAYSLFQSGAKAFASGFLTSRIYHLASQRDERVQFWSVVETRPLFVEYIGLLRLEAADSDAVNSLEDRNELSVAMQFISFLRSSEAQRILFLRNWMFPIEGSDVVFDRLNDVVTDEISGAVSEEQKNLRRLPQFQVFAQEIEKSFRRLKQDSDYTQSLLVIEQPIESEVLSTWIGP